MVSRREDPRPIYCRIDAECQTSSRGGIELHRAAGPASNLDVLAALGYSRLLQWRDRSVLAGRTHAHYGVLGTPPPRVDPVPRESYSIGGSIDKCVTCGHRLVLNFRHPCRR